MHYINNFAKTPSATIIGLKPAKSGKKKLLMFFICMLLSVGKFDLYWVPFTHINKVVANCNSINTMYRLGMLEKTT